MVIFDLVQKAVTAGQLTGHIKGRTLSHASYEHKLDVTYPAVAITYDNKTVTVKFNYEKNCAEVYRVIKHGEEPAIPLKEITIRNLKDFSTALGPILTTEFGPRRPPIAPFMAPIFNEWSPDAKHQEYRYLNKSAFVGEPFVDTARGPGSPAPRSFIQVLALRAQAQAQADHKSPDEIRRAGLLCFSFVKARFALYFGVRPAIDFGMFEKGSTGLASQFIPNPKYFTTTNTVDPSVMRQGTIVRLSNHPGTPTHIGIVAGNGQVEHLIGGTLIREPLKAKLDSGWDIVQVHLPNKPMNLVYSADTIHEFVKLTTKSYGHDVSLDSIAADIIKHAPYFKGVPKHQAMMVVEEAIYALNQQKFRYMNDHHGVLSVSPKYDNLQLYIPGSWSSSPGLKK